jgi:hypothetical protein
MRIVEFRNLLDEKNALRVEFELDQGKVTNFVVQLECRFGDKFVPVVRYDTAHNFAHCDRLHPYEPPQKIRMSARNFNELLTYAIQDLTDHWKTYRRRYEIWMNGR